VASSFRILSSRRTIQVRSQTLVEDVQEIVAEALPSGVTFTRLVPLQTFQAQGASALIAPIANNIQAIIDQGYAVGGIGVQKVDANGLISNWVDFTVEINPPDATQPGPFTTTVEVSVQALHDQTDFADTFDPTIQNLAALASA